MRYSNLPGLDDVYNWNQDNLTPKIASSVARTFGKQDNYCKVFAAYGWSITIEKMKQLWIGCMQEA
jgi:hypothetical protein